MEGKGITHQFRKEGLGLQVAVVLLEQGLGGVHHAEGEHLEALALESGNDFTDQAALNAIGFDLRPIEVQIVSKPSPSKNE
jgi:hypothetical protein